MKWKNSENNIRVLELFAFFPTKVGDYVIWFEWYKQHQQYYLGSWINMGRRIIDKHSKEYQDYLNSPLDPRD